MITSKEIRDAEFSKIMRGYNPDEVDALLERIADQVDVMTVEKNELEQKMMFLAGKLEEYRGDEDKIRNALLGAQKMGDSVLQEAKQKAEILMRDANIKAEKIVESAHSRVEREELSLAKLRAEVAKFKTEILSLYKEHLDLISALPEPEMPQQDIAAPAEQAPQPAENASIGSQMSFMENISVQQPAVQQISFGNLNAQAQAAEVPQNTQFEAQTVQPQAEPAQTQPNAFPIAQPQQMPAAAEQPQDIFTANAPAQPQDSDEPAIPEKFQNLDFGENFKF